MASPPCCHGRWAAHRIELAAAIARVPAPALRVDLEVATYPAVVTRALAPVLVGVLGAAPAPVRLRWLDQSAVGRARWLLVDMLADPGDWLVLVPLAAGAVDVIPFSQLVTAAEGGR
ncbi:hypothetical protein [Pseudonocardia asaccharolytica]|uniref:hypothetical protein n=1 Tax=Pseudonocardia asaccharolytica TaxID=54010 RepID=UPI000417E9FD|nr:hypothetical protein [Pseudonocardia asaccharolytica]